MVMIPILLLITDIGPMAPTIVVVVAGCRIWARSIVVRNGSARWPPASQQILVGEAAVPLRPTANYRPRTAASRPGRP
jgi:hypothetical protein